MNNNIKNSPRNRVLLSTKDMNKMLEKMEKGFSLVIFDSIGEQPPFTVRLSVSYFNEFDILYSEPDKETGRFWCGYLIYYNDKFEHERFYEFIKYAARVWSPRDIVYGRNKMLSWEDGYGFRQQWPVFKCNTDDSCNSRFTLTGDSTDMETEFVFDSYNKERHLKYKKDGEK